jgi:predicted Rossmann fold flavoprotein
MATDYDVIIIGAGAAGLFCAIEAGKRGRRVWLIDHMEKIAEKIRISGGGRCNFTNIHTHPDFFLSQNPHFCKSALKQYTAQDFIALVKKHGIAFHEKKLGQLFCDHSAQDIITMLLSEAANNGVRLETRTKVHEIKPISEGYSVHTDKGEKSCESLVIATGGLSIPKIGATNFGYEIAKKFGLGIIPPQPALVPLTFEGDMLEKYKTLSGLSVEASVQCHKTSFCEGLLFTHRGLSGPSILQISSYWKAGDPIIVNIAPETNVSQFLKDRKQTQPKVFLSTVLSEIIPKRLAQIICDDLSRNAPLADLSHAKIDQIAAAVNAWQIHPTGTEGYRTAEVTLGGVDTRDLSSRTMESEKNKGLYFIGEVVDVTGHLGGFNFQWAWSSGFVAGQNV